MYWNMYCLITASGAPRLTLTWDVLKFSIGKIFLNGMGLTLTWDVLKSEVHQAVQDQDTQININMRCIEIDDYIAF